MSFSFFLEGGGEGCDNRRVVAFLSKDTFVIQRNLELLHNTYSACFFKNLKQSRTPKADSNVTHKGRLPYAFHHLPFEQ